MNAAGRAKGLLGRGGEGMFTWNTRGRNVDVRKLRLNTWSAKGVAKDDGSEIAPRPLRGLIGVGRLLWNGRLRLC